MLFSPKEKGQGLVEYALILVLIAVLVLGVLLLLGTRVSAIFSSIVSGLNP
jgi:pilus assembly protein Flp/PilA